MIIIIKNTGALKMDDFFEMLLRRQSCRNYDIDKPVEKEKVLKCVEAGRIAPSACNSQPWHFYAVTDPDVVPAVREGVMPKGSNTFAKNVNAFIVITQEKPAFIERVADMAMKRGFSDMDIGIAVAHIVLAAEAQGLSTCILGMMDDKKLADTLGLPEKTRFKLTVAIGYAAEDDPVRSKKRKSLEEICTII